MSLEPLQQLVGRFLGLPLFVQLLVLILALPGGGALVLGTIAALRALLSERRRRRGG